MTRTDETIREVIIDLDRIDDLLARTIAKLNKILDEPVDASFPNIEEREKWLRELIRRE